MGQHGPAAPHRQCAIFCIKPWGAEHGPPQCWRPNKTPAGSAVPHWPWQNRAPSPSGQCATRPCVHAGPLPPHAPNRAQRQCASTAPASSPSPARPARGGVCRRFSAFLAGLAGLAGAPTARHGGQFHGLRPAGCCAALLPGWGRLSCNCWSGRLGQFGGLLGERHAVLHGCWICEPDPG